MHRIKTCFILTCLITMISLNLSAPCDDSIKPINSNECTRNSDNSTNYCCMVSSPGFNPVSSKCLQIPINSYSGQNIYIMNNLTWNLDCGKPAVTPVKGAACGNPNPVFAYDCWQFSTMESSCCQYLSGNTTGTAACQWLGGKIVGNTTKNTPNGYLLNCSATYLSFNMSLFILVLAYLILI